jgi:hypothetical protein
MQPWAQKARRGLAGALCVRAGLNAMLTKNDLESLVQVRLDDAIFLLQANHSSSAYYLAGYAVELALKACI